MQRKWRRAWQRQVKRVSKQKVVQIFLPPLMAAGILLGSITSVSANPTGGQVTVGSGSITQNGKVMTVTQNTNKLGINWQGFNIQAGEKVNFVQPNSQSVALNRVIGNEGSKIYGQLSANGQVFLMNPNGVLFAPGAQVNVGGIVATTQNLTDSNFQKGNYQFSGNGGAVVNQGTITAANGGYVALLGNQVSNEGVIVAKQGTVALGAGSGTTLDFNGDGLLNLTVSQPAIQALAENKNLIQADGGQVMMTARAADALAGTVVNNTGMIQARSIETKNGVITLDGGPTGTVSVSGTLDATGNEAGRTGGTVKVLGSNITVQNATLSVSGGKGGGTVLVGGNFHGQGPEYNATTTTIGQNAVIQADALTHGDGGKVVVWSNDSTNFSGTITAKGGADSGNGGSVETSGHKLKVSGWVDTTAAKGATGNWLLDPYDFNIGGSNYDVSVADLKNALINNNVTITTSSSSSSLTSSGGTSINGTHTGQGDINVNESVTLASSHTLTLSAYNNININASIAISGGLTLTAGTSGSGNGIDSGIINATAAINVYTFTLNGGTWRQIGNILPYFRIMNDFRISGGTFIRVLDSDGTSASPYRISDVYGLQGIGSSGMLSKSYALENNINISDASVTAYWNGGAGFSPIGSSSSPFTGTFNGMNHTISGLTINRSSNSIVGLFGQLSGAIQNVGLTSTSIQGYEKVGGLVGYNNGGTIKNSYSMGNVTGSSCVGGLVGETKYGLISGSYSMSNVTGGNYGFSGGLVGLSGSTIENSYSTGSVTGTDYVGGLVGYVSANGGGSITNSYSTSSVAGNSYVGGLAGGSSCNITNSYSTGRVTGNSNVGGLVGGGFGTITNCYWDVYTSGQTVGGNGAMGLTSQGANNSAYAKNCYSGWDISDTGGSNTVWRIYEGQTYPLLRRFLTPLTVSAESVTKTYDGEIYSGSPNGVMYSGQSGPTSTPPSNVFGTPSYGNGTNAGTYHLSGLYSNQQGYDIIYSNSSKLTIDQRNITVTADNQSRIYGDANPSSGAVSLTSGSLANGDALGNASLSSNATATSGVGGYTLTPSGVSFTSGSASNYNITYANGILTITPRDITITADASTVYGDTHSVSAVERVISGSMVNGDTLGNPFIGIDAMTATRPVGTYTLNYMLKVGGVYLTRGALDNYNITFADGTLTITPRPITVTANASKVYGDVNPSSGAVMVTTGRLVNGDTLGNASLSSAATAASPVGSYALTPSGVSFTSGSAANYNITYTNGTLAITPRNITVTANNQNRTYGDANPSSGIVSLTAGSLVNGDTLGNASLSSAATTASNVGSYALTPSGVSFTSGNGSNYHITYADGMLTITPRDITVTANASKVYGDANPSGGAVTVTTGRLVNGDTLGNASLSSAATTASNVGSYALTPSGVSFTSGSASNYNITYTNGTLAITPRDITVTANNQSRTYGDTNPSDGAVTVSTGSLVNGDTLGNASLSSAATTASNVGSYTLTPSGVNFTSGNDSNYHITYADGTLTVNPRNITVIANDQSRSYGDTNPSSGTVSLTAGNLVNGDTLGNAALSSAATPASNVGSYALTPSGVSFTSGNASNYNITYTNGTLAITPRNITVTANDQSRIYGDTNPSSGAVTVTTGSMVNGDTLGNASLSGNATTVSNVGSYALTPSGVSFTSGSASNYNITYTNGTLTITPRNITVTANDQSRIYGDGNPTSGAVVVTTGSLINGDTLGNANLNSAATTVSNVGSYALTPSGVSFTSGSTSNYHITYADSTLTIIPRNITVTANDQSRSYGDTNPSSGTVSLTAGNLVNGDALGNASLSSAATTANNVGSYTLTPSGVSFTSGNAANYNISYANGVLTITPRNITVTANASKVYGDANPSSGAATVSTGSMVNGDTLGNASLSSAATATSGVGNYALTPSGVSFMSGNASNYNITYTNGTLTINPRNMTVTANNTTKWVGTPNPRFTATYSGLAGGDTPSSLDGALIFTTLATTASPVGSYLITPSGLSSANYNITYQNGILIVTQRPDSYHGALIAANHSGSNGPSLLGMTNSFGPNLAEGANPLLVVSAGGINLGSDQSDNQTQPSKEEQGNR